MSAQEPIIPVPVKIPKERTIIAFFIGAFFGRYGLPFGMHMIYVWVIVMLIIGKPLFSYQLAAPGSPVVKVASEPFCGCEIPNKGASNGISHR